MKHPAPPRLPLLLAIASLSLAATGHAAVVAQYNFSAVGVSNTVTPQPATTADANVTASTFAPILNGAASASTTAMYFSTASNARLFHSSVQAGTSASLSDDYWQFSITPIVPKAVVYDTLVFGWQSPSWSGSNSVTWDVRSSVNSYASTLGTFTTSTINDSGAPHSANISSLGQQYGTVTFRIYNYSASALSSGASNMLVDTVIINGTVVPEPTAAMLGLLGLGGLALRRRRD